VSRTGRGLLPLLAWLAAACTTTAPSPATGPASSPAADPARVAARHVAEADALAAAGRAKAALAGYERVLREHSGEPAAADALYRLGRLQADPEGGARNYRAAHRAFSRLLADHPQSRWDAEARAWRRIVAALIAQEDEAARLKTQIERLRRTDLELERRR
jgi:hypothetical protein